MEWKIYKNKQKKTWHCEVSNEENKIDWFTDSRIEVTRLHDFYSIS